MPLPFVPRTLPLKIVAPLVSGIILSIVVMVYATLGFNRLDLQNRSASGILEMQSALTQVLLVVVDAETGQRGYLLTGIPEYLEPYKAATERYQKSFRELLKLVRTHGTIDQRERLARLNTLAGNKQFEMESTIALFDTGNRDAAIAVINTGNGKRTMDALRAEYDQLQLELEREVNTGVQRWDDDIEFARLGMFMMTAFTVALLVVVWILARREIATREDQRRRVASERDRLDLEIRERTAELAELSTHLHVVQETERAKLARDIHDELGSILVSAKMDVAWVQDRLRRKDPENSAKLERALGTLDDGVDIKRRIIEELRPTLLDNLGLSAALEWQLHEICDKAKIACQICLPDGDDSALPPSQSIALYRILQESLTNVVKYAQAKKVNVSFDLTSDGVSLTIEDDGVGIPERVCDHRLSHGIAGMRQRVRAFDGEFSITRRPEGGTIIKVRLPLQRSDEKKAGTETAPA
ncbi:MAG: CHASE3 domain-containing protein [Betaproteobacteria bacterium]|nr:CHASE3 domain-containing protein [Betaproteobacteria bacterium]